MSKKSDKKSAEDPVKAKPDKPTEVTIASVEEMKIVPTQESENMETHAHHLHHAPGEKVWHYFYEFLMLFLAVFCGFLAENAREHYVENERAKELAVNLYNELIADSVNIQERVAIRKTKENECAYFITYVKDSNLIVLPDRFFPAFSYALIAQRYLFEPSDGILNQLRNSGELRYFKSPELQAAVGKLSVAISNIRNRNEREYSMAEIYIRPFVLKFYDFKWYDAFCQYGKVDLFTALTQRTAAPVKGQIPNVEKFNRQEAENLASYYLLMLRGTRISQYAEYATINHQLLQILRKEYPLE
jgi:hypothetical protein